MTAPNPPAPADVEAVGAGPNAGKRALEALDELDAMRPEDYMGPAHLAPAFRTVDFRRAFSAVCEVVNRARAEGATRTETPAPVAPDTGAGHTSPAPEVGGEAADGAGGLRDEIAAAIEDAGTADDYGCSWKDLADAVIPIVERVRAEARRETLALDSITEICANAWDEGAEAGYEHAISQGHPGPQGFTADPPRNPYDREAQR